MHFLCGQRSDIGLDIGATMGGDLRWAEDSGSRAFGGQGGRGLRGGHRWREVGQQLMMMVMRMGLVMGMGVGLSLVTQGWFYQITSVLMIRYPYHIIAFA